LSDAALKRLARLRGETFLETYSTLAPAKPKEPSDWTDEDKKQWRKKIIVEIKAAGKSYRLGKDGSITQINGSKEFFPTQVFRPPWWKASLADLMSGPPAHELVYKSQLKQEQPAESTPVEPEPVEASSPLSGQTETSEATDANEQLSRIAGHDVYTGKPRPVFRFESGKVFEHRNLGGAEVQIRLKKNSFKNYEDLQGRDVRVVDCKTAPGTGYILQDDGTWLPLNNKEDRTPPRPEFRPVYQPPAKPNLLPNLCDHQAGVCVGHCTSPNYEQTPLSRAPKSK
jgi:hypothetical protein